MKRTVGAVLIAVAVACAVTALLLWVNGTEQADDDQLAEDYRAAIDGEAPREIDPDRAGPIAVAAVGGVLFLGGVILVKD